MSQFDLIFALLSLLLGLSIAELLSGFARVLRLKARQRAVAKGVVRVNEADDAPPPVRVGWLVPLLGLYVLVDQDRSSPPPSPIATRCRSTCSR